MVAPNTLLAARLAGVDSAVAIKAPVAAATTANITLAGFQTIDGVTYAAPPFLNAPGVNNRCLVKNQTDQTTNGLYDVQSGNWTRCADFAGSTQFGQGTLIIVSGGTSNAGVWQCTSAPSSTLPVGSFAITFAIYVAQFLAVPLTIPNGGTGQITKAAAFDALSPTSVEGDLIYFSGATNTALPAGTVGQPLLTQGSSAAPAWLASTQTSGYHLQASGVGANPSWVGFLQAGSGAATRTWQDKGRDFVSILDFGGKGDNTTDNTTPLTNALAALTGTGGVIYFPAGKYKFSSKVSFSYPAGIFSVALTGAGQDATELTWPNASGGLAFTYNGISSTAHFRDLSITTGQNGGGNGIALSLSGVSNVAATDFYRVTFRGADGYNVANYWNNCINIVNVSNVQVSDVVCFGAGTNGAGIIIAGVPASSLYATQLDISESVFQSLNLGVVYGSFVQGVTISQTNFTGVAAGVIVPSSQTGVLAQLAISDSQFFCSSNAVVTNTQVNGVLIVNTLFIVPASATAIDLAAVTHVNITGNQVTSQSVTGTNGIIVNGSFGTVADNDVTTFGTGIWLQASSANLNVSGNTLEGNTSNIVNSGTNNFIVNNPGYNPVGASSIVVGGSPFTYTAGASPETVYVRTGGTISAITIGAQTIASAAPAVGAPITMELGPFESFVTTYAGGTPIMIKMVH